ncbi:MULTISPECIES: ABC transporter permease [Anoxynatronum]|uniref:Spermidine/putrescine transport system permease protein n=2 Tax=Anoxynatronum TaxID=210622 RepID=A0AA46AK82_9CLOT|nr:ABC transporter permease [Anoxynatronum buryatiense]SMP67346.1 putative spermidine/putrescine transport system permease protein [Anoxynatronum buryatiense]
MKLPISKKNRERLNIFLLLLPGVGFIAFFFISSLMTTVIRSFQMDGIDGYTIANYSKVLQPYFLDSILYSIWIGISSAFGSLLFALPLCFLMRNHFRGKNLLNSLIKIPLFIPALVATFLIVNFLAPHGMLNLILMRLNLIREPLKLVQDKYGIGIMIIQIWKNIPFQMLIIMAVMESINPALVDAARNLGANRWQVARHVLIPLSMPGILVSVILVFIRAYGGFEIPKLAGPVYPIALPVLMHTSITEMFDWDTGSVVGTVIIISAMIMVAIYTKLAKKIQGGDIV